ncbi:MAG: NrsF family protein [Bryobacteraceae bacterium]|jgi:hypothetical protein
MNCADIDRALARQETLSPDALPAEAGEHARSCPRCRALLEVLSAPPSASELRPEVARAIGERIARNLEPVRPLRPAGYYAAGFALIFLGPIAAGIGILKASGIAGMGPSMIAIVFGGLALCGALLAVSLADEMAPASRRLLPPAVLTGGILLAVAANIWALFPHQPETRFWVQAGKCLLLGIGFAAPTAALAWNLLRRGALLSPAISGAAAGLLGGLAGTTVLEIHCPDWNAAHILVAHWGTALACAAAGLLAGAIMQKLQSGADHLARTVRSLNETPRREH